jgi:murein DD-endopeptidase MepM/ murein hydrolase activator NlpD
MAEEIKHVISIEANLSRIQGQLKTLEGNFSSSFNRISSLASGLASTLGISLSIGGVVSATKQLLDFADTLKNLSDQTGLSVEALSGIKSVVEESGSSLSTFAQGVFNLQKNLGGIDDETDKAAVAIKDLGLNLDELRNASPDEFIKQISAALARIENPIQRNTLLFNLLGKSAKELGPVFRELVGHFDELKSQGVSAETIAALDAVGDAFTRLKNNMLAVGAEGLANVLRFFGVIRDVAALAPELDRANVAMARVLNVPVGKIEGMSSKAIIEAASKVPEGIKRSATLARDELLNLREEMDRLTKQSQVPKTPAPFAGLSSANKKQIEQTENFFDGLEKQLDTLESKRVGLRLGPEAELGAQLDAQFKAFKDKLAAEKIPIPKGLDAQFEKIKASILGANQELSDTTKEMEKIAALGKMLNQDSAEWINVDADLSEANRKTAEFRRQFNDLRQGLEVGAIDTTTPQGAERKRVTEIELEFVRTANRITEIGQQAGASQEQIAADIALAWKKAVADINSQRADPAGVFQGLDNELKKIDVQAAVFGGRFDSVAASIDATRKAILDLLNLGLDPLDPKIQELNEKLKNLEGVEAMRESFESVFDAITNGIDDTLKGVIMGTQKFGDAMANLARNIVIAIANELNKELILKPLRQALQNLLPSAPSTGSGSTGAASTGLLDWLQQMLGFGAESPAELLAGPPEYAKGGRVKQLPLAFANGGEVPAILHEGEFVIRRDSAQKLGPRLLEILNQTGGEFQIPTQHFAAGGRVGSLAMLPIYYGGGGLAANSGQEFGWTGSGAKTTVIINNNSGQPATQERRKTGFDTEEILVTIGKRMARDVQSGGDLGRAIGDTFGMGRSPINRG